MRLTGRVSHTLVGVDCFGPYTLGSWFNLADGLAWLEKARANPLNRGKWSAWWWEIR